MENKVEEILRGVYKLTIYDNSEGRLELLVDVLEFSGNYRIITGYDNYNCVYAGDISGVMRQIEKTLKKHFDITFKPI